MNRLATLVLTLSLALLAACGGGGEDEPTAVVQCDNTTAQGPVAPGKTGVCAELAAALKAAAATPQKPAPLAGQ